MLKTLSNTYIYKSLQMRELNSEEKRRYSRSILLDEIGEEGQKKLLKSSVLIIGAGALGSIVAMYLAASGVGHICIADFDTIDISNLQRQLSFTEDNVGTKKVDATAQRLKSINSDIKIEIIDRVIKQENALDLFENFDFIVEGSDNPATKYMVTDCCKKLQKPYCLGGVAQFKGQVMTFIPGSMSYRDLFPESAEEGGYMPCSIGGVLGPLPGIIGSIQACETIKHIVGCGELLTNRLLLIDALTMNLQIISFE